MDEARRLGGLTRLQSIANAGCEGLDTPASERVRLANILSIGLGLSTTILVVAALLAGSWLTAALGFAAVVGYAAGPALNHHRSYALGTSAPIVAALAGILLFHLAAGPIFGFHLATFILACWPFALFDLRKQGRTVATLLIVSGAVFVSAELEWLPAFRLFEAAPSVIHVVRPATGVVVFTFFSTLLFVLTFRNQNQQARLVAQASELHDARIAAESALKSRAQFMALMSHELRTPLNGILGATQLLEEAPLAEEFSEPVAVLRYSGEYLFCLIADMLEAVDLKAKPLKLRPEPTQVCDLCRRVVADYKRIAEAKGLELRTAVQCPEAPLVVDSGRLSQVLHHLVSNAIKFTEQGHVLLAASGKPTEDGGFALTFEVSDTGIGIRAELKRKIFDEFSQAEDFEVRRANGIGLGLSTASRVVSAMGGQLSVNSAVGEGSTFSFVLEMAAAPAVKAPPEVELHEPGDEAHIPNSGTRTAHMIDEQAPCSGLRVLVAEDNPVNQKVLVRLLSKLGIQPKVVEHGGLAVEACKNGTWDLVLMDIQMPEMDGLEATRRIRDLEGNTKHTQIVAVSANANSDQIDEGIRAGLDAYLTKPVRLADIRQVVGDVRREA